MKQKEIKTPIAAELKGYFVDDKSDRIDGYTAMLRPATEREEEGLDGDDNVFFYYENFEALKAHKKEGKKTKEDFVVTGYTLIYE